MRLSAYWRLHSPSNFTLKQILSTGITYVSWHSLEEPIASKNTIILHHYFLKPLYSFNKFTNWTHLVLTIHDNFSSELRWVCVRIVSLCSLLTCVCSNACVSESGEGFHFLVSKRWFGCVHSRLKKIPSDANSKLTWTINGRITDGFKIYLTSLLRVLFCGTVWRSEIVNESEWMRVSEWIVLPFTDKRFLPSTNNN